MERHGVEDALEVPGLKDVIDVPESGLFDDLVRLFQIQPFRDEEHPVQAVDILHGEGLVRPDSCLRFCGVCGEQDRQDTTEVLLIYIVRLEIPLIEDDCRDVVPARKYSIRQC